MKIIYSVTDVTNDANILITSNINLSEVYAAGMSYVGLAPHSTPSLKSIEQSFNKKLNSTYTIENDGKKVQLSKSSV